jgi:hypothetical protein
LYSVTTSHFKPVFFFDRCHLGLALRGGVFVRGLKFDRALHALRHVLVRGHHVDFEIGAFQLILARGRVKAIFDEIAPAGRKLRDLPSADVLVGEDQAVGRNE